MSKKIQVPQMPWQMPTTMDLTFPDDWQIDVYNMAGYDRPALTEDQIKLAVANPIESPPISVLARGKQEVVIIFDDMTRPTRVAKILPFVLEELTEAGIPDSRIRLIAASGSHGDMNRLDFSKKLGEATLARFPAYNHNCYENCTYAGTTSLGTEVFINSEFMYCDLKIAIGSTLPHVLTVFGGGGKMIIPGVAAIETIAATHSMAAAEESSHASSSLRQDMKEAAALVGLDIIIDCILNMWSDTAAIYCGAVEPAHEAAVKDAQTHYLCSKAEDKDVVIANTYAKSMEAANGLKAAASVSNNGGSFVLIANAPEGQVVHHLSGPFGRTIGGRQRLKFPIPEQIERLIIYSQYPDFTNLDFFKETDRVLMMDDWDEVIQTLQEAHGDGLKVAVYPNADIIYFA